MKKKSVRQNSTKISNPNACIGHSEVTPLPDPLRLSGYGCTKDEAFEDLCDKLLSYLETHREFNCEKGICNDENMECVTEIGESPLERRVLYLRIRRRGCPHNVGWKASLRGKNVRSNCICVPRLA